MKESKTEGPTTLDPPGRITERQWWILNRIYESARDRGYQPSVRELMEELGFKASNGVYCHIRVLDRKGWIDVSNGDSRSIRLLYRPDGKPFTGFRDKP